jgi:hypothetical protein
MRQRIRHIGMVIAITPVLYGVERFLGALNNQRPQAGFGQFVWEMMWEDLSS